MKSSIVKNLVVAALVAVLFASSAVAQAGGSPDFDSTVEILYGRVVKAEKVKIEGDGRVAGLATLGGMAGLAYGHSNNKTKKDTRKRALGGALLGGAVGKKSGGGSHEIFQYTVRLLDGQTTQVATEQDEFREADCVVIEAVAEMWNVRRVPDKACEPGAQPVVQQQRAEFVEEAAECAEAKQQLLAAPSDALQDAITKVELLCGG